LDPDEELVTVSDTQVTWLTQEAYDRLKQELDELIANRPVMAAEINARREDGDLWSIAARTIDVVELSFDGGDEIELVENEGSTELRVDGQPWNEQIPALERAGETLGTDFVVQADRLDGDLWEIRASAL